MDPQRRLEKQESDAMLLAEYVAAFDGLDDLSSTTTVPSELWTHTDEYDQQHWQPRQITTSPSALQGLYKGLGLPGEGSTRFPRLYEALLLSYRWLEVYLGNYRLLPNEPAEDFTPLLSAMCANAYLRATLMANGYVQFGKAEGLDYDPVCFDFRHRQKNGDCRIVRLDHEAIACYGRIGTITELAPNFRSLVLDTIRRAAAVSDSRDGA